MCGLSRNLGASAYWNPQGLSGSVMGLLYLCFTFLPIKGWPAKNRCAKSERLSVAECLGLGPKGLICNRLKTTIKPRNTNHMQRCQVPDPGSLARLVALSSEQDTVLIQQNCTENRYKVVDIIWFGLCHTVGVSMSTNKPHNLKCKKKRKLCIYCGLAACFGHLFGPPSCCCIKR